MGIPLTLLGCLSPHDRTVLYYYETPYLGLEGDRPGRPTQTVRHTCPILLRILNLPVVTKGLSWKDPPSWKREIIYILYVIFHISSIVLLKVLPHFNWNYNIFFQKWRMWGGGGGNIHYKLSTCLPVGIEIVPPWTTSV